MSEKERDFGIKTGTGTHVATGNEREKYSHSEAKRWGGGKCKWMATRLRLKAIKLCSSHLFCQGSRPTAERNAVR